MVTVFLRGGLGNQMFEYAAGLSLAKKNGAELVLDTVHLRDRFPRPRFSYRTYDLGVFAIEPQFTAVSRLADGFPLPGVWLGLDLLGIAFGHVLGVRKIVHEKSSVFDPSVLAARGNVLLYGRWQSEKYFADAKDDVRAAFRFREPLAGEAKALAGKIAGCNSVSLHVRRGDYAAFKNVEQLMGKTDLGYYDRAVKYIAGRAKDPQLFVFSDDIAWCRANLELPFPATYVDDASRGPKAAFHLELMSRCKHNIITNSTFSWWGAWLNANPGKIVIAPEHWFADGRGGDEDIIPAGWVKI
jgi:hypothetical protein